MARKYEGSAADKAQDAKGMKATGMSKKAYEGSARDKAEDAAGEDRVKVKPHFRKPPTRPMPAPPPQAGGFGLAPAPGESDDGLNGGM
jgi:hypothetical protein